MIGYDEVNIVADAIEAAGSTEPAAIIEQLAAHDYTGISGTSSWIRRRGAPTSRRR